MDQKNKGKKLKAKNVVIILVLAIITIVVSFYIANNSLQKSSQGQEQFKRARALEYYFSNSKVEFLERYKNKDIYKIYLDEKIYYVAYNKDGESIDNPSANAHLVKNYNSTQIMYANVDETVIVIYENKNDKKGDYVLTLYTSISDLKEVLDVIG